MPFQFGHKLEIHTIKTSDERRGHKHYRGHRKNLDDAVLFHINQAEEGVLQRFEPGEIKRGVLQEGACVFDNHAKFFAFVVRKNIAFQQGGNQALHFAGALPEKNDKFLQLVDLDQYVLVEAFAEGEAFAGGVDFSRQVFQEVGFDIDAGFKEQ